MPASAIAPPPVKLTLTRKELPDGCWVSNAAPLVTAAILRARGPKERAGFPRFILRVDGERITPATPAALARQLERIAPGCMARIFTNGGKGATIDFE